MVVKKGVKAGRAVEDLARVPLQAILLADSFSTKLGPITLECPKVLLPLVNTPMIDYTLAWLESADVEEVFVLCCSHSKQIINYLDKSKWVNRTNFSVTTIECHDCLSVGDALRLIYERDVIQADFILVSGDTVSNMMLTQALEEHKERQRKDINAFMTMVIKPRETRLGTDELIMAIDPTTKELLYYEDDLKGALRLDKSFLTENPCLSLHNDKQDCYIDICSPQVLTLFSDNFDYQDLRHDFVKGLLVDELMGFKIFTHEIHSSYAARIDNFRSYDSISKDIIQRWTYPLVPDVQFSTNCPTKLERHGVYRACNITQSRSSQVGPFTYIGKDTYIGDKTVISNSVVGDGCKIGSNVSIDGCYIWNNVTIHDGCKLRHAILCDGVVMKSRAVLEPGVVLSYKVVVGQEFVVRSYSKVSLLPQPVKQDSDEELEYAVADDSNSGIIADNLVENGDSIGENGGGFIWSMREVDHEEEWRLCDVRESDTESDDDDDERDESHFFEKEVEETFLRGVHEKVKDDHIILEVQSLRLSYNMAPEKCATALLYSMMKLALDTSKNSGKKDLLKKTNDVISQWGKLLKPFVQGIDEEIEVIMKFEEICLESAKEYATLFVHVLYDKCIIREDAIVDWADEDKRASESDRVFLEQSKKFLQWLREAPEEED